MAKQKWAIIGDVTDGEVYGAPRIIRAEDALAEQRRVDEMTGGNCGITVLAEVETEYLAEG